MSEETQSRRQQDPNIRATLAGRRNTAQSAAIGQGGCGGYRAVDAPELVDNLLHQPLLYRRLHVLHRAARLNRGRRAQAPILGAPKAAVRIGVENSQW